jgi:hypothetical protein
VEVFNSVVTQLFSLLLAPLAGLPAIYGLLAVSVISGIMLLYIYGLVSNQGALKRVKKRITAGIYESVLFRHDLALSLRAQAGMLLGGARYFALAVPPLAILLIPSLVILAQLNLRYGARPLSLNEPALVTVNFKNDEALFETELTSTDSEIKITPPLRDLDSNSVTWRITAPKETNSNTHTLKLVVNGIVVEKEIFVGKQPEILPAESHTFPWWQFFYPGETVAPELKSLVQSISIAYPDQEHRVAGVSLHWLVVFAIVSIASGLLASRILRIEI